MIAISHDGITRSIGQVHARAINRHILVITLGVLVIGHIHCFLFSTNITHNITFGLSWSFELSSNTAIVTQTFLAAPVRVQSAVTSRLIGMEVSLHDITRNTMTNNAIVTSISHSINSCGRGTSPERNIRIESRIG